MRTLRGLTESMLSRNIRLGSHILKLLEDRSDHCPLSDGFLNFLAAFFLFLFN